jgi:hypothetical protein
MKISIEDLSRFKDSLHVRNGKGFLLFFCQRRSCEDSVLDLEGISKRAINQRSTHLSPVKALFDKLFQLSPTYLCSPGPCIHFLEKNPPDRHPRMIVQAVIA